MHKKCGTVELDTPPTLYTRWTWTLWKHYSQLEYEGHIIKSIYNVFIEMLYSRFTYICFWNISILLFLWNVSLKQNKKWLVWPLSRSSQSEEWFIWKWQTAGLNLRSATCDCFVHVWGIHTLDELVPICVVTILETFNVLAPSPPLSRQSCNFTAFSRNGDIGTSAKYCRKCRKCNP